MADDESRDNGVEDGIDTQTPQRDETEEEGGDILDSFPDRGLTTEQYYSVLADDRVTKHEPLYETGNNGRLGSFLIEVNDEEWVGFHYIEPARQWIRTYTGGGYEFVLKAHELYVAQDRRTWDERQLTDDQEETPQPPNAGRSQTPTMEKDDN
jgi:hypothetical protein